MVQLPTFINFVGLKIKRAFFLKSFQKRLDDSKIDKKLTRAKYGSRQPLLKIDLSFNSPYLLNICVR